MDWGVAVLAMSHWVLVQGRSKPNVRKPALDPGIEPIWPIWTVECGFWDIERTGGKEHGWGSAMALPVLRSPGGREAEISGSR